MSLGVLKGNDLEECQKLLFSEAAKPKGKGKGVPQLGDPDGPVIVQSGWLTGYKIWVGDLPRNMDKVEIGKLCPGQLDVAMNNTRSKSGHAFAVIAFEDVGLAMEAFERLQWTRFDHGGGQLHWPSVKWFRPWQAAASAAPDRSGCAALGCCTVAPKCEIGHMCI